ncbi:MULTISPECIES: c-type cytochrome [unclassified Arenibacter]|uniref:c-type cytochrome n=1 Tax=unclassified Arenibacter TaxID=2615047 RepID=UPI000E342722|nr:MULTISPECIES: c-type cytochrome [unclassified Arenibacter]MCM4162391.1 cytochrome c [Arenibacter sp. A80]RFT57986.1 cytochrome c [Arenibacter sp. P308M17]
MKKLLKILGVSIGVILLLVGIGILFISANDIPSYEVQKIDFKVNSSPEAIARGEKLTVMLCAGCHLSQQTNKLTGHKMMDAPPEFGEIYSQNITQDNTYGIGDWTDGELVYLLRTGIKRDGQYSPPYMAKLPHMADEDINAIISFLRSDHPMVKADPTPDTPSEPSLLTKLLCRVAFKPLPMPTETISIPKEDQTVELGKYLAQNLDCFSCHSADFKTNDFLNPELSVGYFAGGNKPLDLQGRVMLTSNLTPDKETGIGNWTKDEFVNTLKYGQIKGEKALSYPMLPYPLLTDAEAGAIFEYLQTIPPIKNKVERSLY